MLLSVIQDLCSHLLTARDNLRELKNMKQPPEPEPPKVFHTQDDIDYHQDLIYQWRAKVGEHSKNIATAEAAERDAKRKLLTALPAQVWVASGVKDTWIGKENSDWPMDEGTFFEKVAADANELPQLKFQRVSTN